MSERWSIDKLQETWLLASRLHNGQKYGGSKENEQIEYINHIGSVTFEILKAVELDNSLDADLSITCAVLHDTIEDTSLSFEDVKDKFGVDVAAGVMALTKNENDPNIQNKMQDSLMRIKLQPKAIWAVKMADRICNLQAPPFYWSNTKKRKYIEEAKLIHSELKSGCKYLAQRLELKIEAYKKHIE